MLLQSPCYSYSMLISVEVASFTPKSQLGLDVATITQSDAGSIKNMMSKVVNQKLVEKY